MFQGTSSETAKRANRRRFEQGDHELDVARPENIFPVVGDAARI